MVVIIIIIIIIIIGIIITIINAVINPYSNFCGGKPTKTVMECRLQMTINVL